VRGIFLANLDNISLKLKSKDGIRNQIQLKGYEKMFLAESTSINCSSNIVFSKEECPARKPNRCEHQQHRK